MVVILSRTAHGNVSVHFHHGCTVDVVDAAVGINIPKISAFNTHCSHIEPALASAARRQHRSTKGM